MSDELVLGMTPRVSRILMSEEAVYGLILVSGMIVVSYNLTGTSLSALVTVVVTVLVFFAAHVYAGTLARLALTEGKAGLPQSLRAAARHSRGMLLISLAPIAVLLLGVTRVVDDDLAVWTALVVDTVALGVLGWLAVLKWTSRFWVRVVSALTTAAFGLVIVAMKAFIHH
ncbi:hypothetical protein NQ152_01910 [Microbacterium sp. zg.B48]|uniref:hypothetical protein n=1 Tax=unclassified Microbacterium TaxID=2609290 RepID=UPI00214B5BDB|nr:MULTISPECIES: hypothetical protein [unclassified Microbacterium]MCR2762257.1 hypothetical protein [Microbacterium sp. zg.B48]WIM17948.1 hypothetical protein QNO12_10005 [Microbacterium sp. zg-B185]